MEKYRSPKGFQDIIPPDSFIWDFVEETAKRVLGSYGYQEVRIPVVEHTEVFVRSIGEVTDIVEKEMYTFSDRANRSLTLRPEGTAPVVRGYVQNGLFTRPAPQKLFYRGPMFRYERPQKGRFRQFYQIGAEAFGVAEPVIDAEMLCMLNEFLSGIGLTDLAFEINSIGCPECRPVFRNALKEFFSTRMESLCSDCVRRLETNPLRILDCKVPGCIEASQGAPETVQHLCEQCSAHFGELRVYLDELGVRYIMNPRLVRGLDYYTGTTFEVTTTELGAQKAVAAGGRYDKLVEEFGGPPTPAIGFAVGMERLAELVSSRNGSGEKKPALFIASVGREAAVLSMKTALKLRQLGLWCEINYGRGSLRNQLRRADKSGAGLAFIIGEEEVSSGNIKFKRLRDGSEGIVRRDDFDAMVALAEGAQVL